MITVGADPYFGNMFETYNPLVLLASQSTDWYIDSDTTAHICTDWNAFSFYQVDSSMHIGWGDVDYVCQIVGYETVDLRFTSKKVLKLRDVQHVPSFHRNVVSNVLLMGDGYMTVLESNKVVFSHFITYIVKRIYL